eukprot:scaffold126678_cov31-Tisochrysis_lutea.AAC.5
MVALVIAQRKQGWKPDIERGRKSMWACAEKQRACLLTGCCRVGGGDPHLVLLLLAARLPPNYVNIEGHTCYDEEEKDGIEFLINTFMESP